MALPIVQPKDDWNTFYQTVPADDIPWELGGPSTELERAVEDGYIVAPSRVLDIGCGLGSQAIYLAKNGFEVVGIDIAPKAIEKAKKLAAFAQAKVSFQVADAASLPFPSDSFDVLYDRACFHHLQPQAQERYKWEVARILTEGGVLLLTLFTKTASLKVLEQFFSPAFVCVDEEIYAVTEKGTGNTISLRTLFLEKHPSYFYEAN